MVQQSVNSTKKLLSEANWNVIKYHQLLVFISSVKDDCKSTESLLYKLWLSFSSSSLFSEGIWLSRWALLRLFQQLLCGLTMLESLYEEYAEQLSLSTSQSVYTVNFTLWKRIQILAIFSCWVPHLYFKLHFCQSFWGK